METFFNPRYRGNIAVADFILKTECPRDFSCRFLMFQESERPFQDLKVKVTARK